MAIALPNVDPGMLVIWWPSTGEEPATRLFTGEHAASEAKKFTMALLERGNGLVRVFSVLEMFQVAGSVVKRIPDQWAPVLDLMLRDQVLGKGLTTAKRGPPKVEPVEYMRRVADGEVDGA